MNYSTFISMERHFHQVCSSDLLSSEWIVRNTVADIYPQWLFLSYGANAGSLFVALRVLCYQSDRTVNTSLEVFLRNQFIGSELIPRLLFETQINATIEEWKSTTTNQYLHTVELIRSTNQGNQLMTILSNIVYDGGNFSTTTTMKPSSYSNCSCILSRSCTFPMGLDDYALLNMSSMNESSLVRNFYIGCYPIEGLLASTLEYFYNQTSMESIFRYLRTFCHRILSVFSP